MPALPPGLYEQLLTEAVRTALAEADLLSEDRPVDPDAAPRILARLLHDQLVSVLASITGPGRTSRQVALINDLHAQLLRAAPERSGLAPADRVAEPARELTAILQQTGGLAHAHPPERPRLPLRSSDLLVNGPRDLRIGSEIPRELASADRVDVLVSFLKWSGVRLVLDPLRKLCERGGTIRVLTTAYLGATEPRALDALADLGAAIAVSYDTQRTRLHAKAWLFHRASGFSTAYIGSSNLSAPALLDGLEWNVRISAIDNRAVLEKFATTFEQYWDDGDFVPYDRQTFREATRKNRDDSTPILPVAIRPYPHQREILDALAFERSRGHTHNLVVSATGTGKTIVAALDYERLRHEHGPLRLLFVAHRREILEQARLTYRTVLRDGSFGDLLAGGSELLDDQHVFATIQSLDADRIAAVEPGHYDVVVVDEFHHAPATSYARLLDHIDPRFLLGLTATPERTDGRSVLPWFDGRIAAELRLWGALERGLLCPFQYFGVHDNTDLSDLRWSRRGYAISDLEALYDGNDARAALVLRELVDKVRDPSGMRALGFCVSRAHAAFMARKFNEAGIRALNLDGETRAQDRDFARKALLSGDVQVLFTVDLFNEGVDLPRVDTLLLLRPTQSATLFLQQLGRGLRLHAGKECLTVLDFIGNMRREFRFDVLYSAVLPGTRRQVRRQVEEGFPTLPPGCAMQLDRKAYDIVMRNLRGRITGSWRGLIDDLSELGDVPLARFLEDAELDLTDLYRGGRCWTDLRRAAGFERRAAGPHAARFARAFGRLLHVDDRDRLDSWRWLDAPQPPAVEATEPLAALQRQLFVGLGNFDRALSQMASAFAELWDDPPMLEELRALRDILDDRLRTSTYSTRHSPLRIHARYSLDEVMAVYDHRMRKDPERLQRPREGVVFHEPTATDLLFFTLDKTESEYSPTTMYEDYPLSPTEFHWESQKGVIGCSRWLA